MENRIGLSQEGTKKVAEHMNTYLANLHVLYTKLHNYHWNVVGPEFFTLHAKLEELYDGVAEEIDEVAERILMIGHRPDASLADYLKKATIKEEASEPVSGRTIVETLLADYTSLIKDLRKAIVDAQEIGDEVSADMMIGALANHEKTVWMLDSYLK
ncbi:MAG: DNA starvation/stationary phase protection protein [Firmicutes bacterium]|nr:DNA starvation/stationary phase protection protein [Bacillota bacterium]